MVVGHSALADSGPVWMGRVRERSQTSGFDKRVIVTSICPTMSCKEENAWGRVA